MSSTLVKVIVSLAKAAAAVATSTGAAFASTSVVVTDSSGTPQPAVVLNGSETPPWTFTTSVNVGAGQVVATDLDVNGASLGSVTQSFTEAGSPPPPVTFFPTTGITVTPA